MCSSPERLLARPLAALALAACLACAQAAAAERYDGIGRAATAKELAAWDIDVRPDFRGLPPGSGSVAAGADLWEAKCASCHGVFGESNEVFNPLVGGTTADDLRSGRVARLKDPAYPARTTLMKVPTVSTLWDYIRRAMPWNAPKSLSADEVYAVTAYLLNLGGIVPDDFTLSDRNIREVQQRMPNRNGMTTAHALWPGKLPGATAAPDVRAAACMHDCADEPRIASSLPEHARDAHGNLALQNRPFGPQRGADTSRAPGGAPSPGDGRAGEAPAAAAGGEPLALIQSRGCTTCHAVDRPLLGPSFREVAARYEHRADAAAYLAGKIRSGGSGTWGGVPMPPQLLADEDIAVLARWLAGGARQ